MILVLVFCAIVVIAKLKKKGVVVNKVHPRKTALAFFLHYFTVSLGKAHWRRNLLEILHTTSGNGHK